jgi:hypothetical protein
MKLYKVERTDYIGWDEYDAVVVYATDEENAKRIGIQYMSTQEERVKVTYIGIADDAMIKEHEQHVDESKKNIILDSFNAG